jgi:transcriptional regulator with XRE-family HTH domain
MYGSSMPKTPPAKTPAGVAVDGEAVRKRRQRLGHTITAFAPLVKVSIGYLSQIERGHRPTVSPATFKRLATALGLDDNPEQIETKQRARKVAA